ncbi:MAG: MBL fold metallo-hydrolase [Candidatus Bathyarchaeia archaeon]
MPIDKTPDKNSIFFVWLNNYAGILVKTPTKTLLIDPVDIKTKSFPQIDAILITHEHYDHLDQRLVAEIQKTTDCSVIADPTSTRSLKPTLPTGKLQETQSGNETKIGAVTIRTEKSNHPPAQTPVTYIITSEDGVRLFHTADSLPFPEMAKIGEREKLDVVFCTVGIAPRTSAETGFEIAWLTKPKIAVPYHTNTPEHQRKFAALLNKELPKTACVIPEQNKIYQITKGKQP